MRKATITLEVSVEDEQELQELAKAVDHHIESFIDLDSWNINVNKTDIDIAKDPEDTDLSQQLVDLSTGGDMIDFSEKLLDTANTIGVRAIYEEYKGIFSIDKDPERNDIHDLWIFHHNDLDGYASAAAIIYCAQNYMNAQNLTIHTEAIDYNVNLRDIFDSKKIEVKDYKNSEFWFVDYSFSNVSNRNFLEHHLLKFAPHSQVVWVDHHQTSVDWMKELHKTNKSDVPFMPHLIVDFKLSGAVLTWEYITHVLLGRNSYIPIFLQYVSDWDTFSHHFKSIIKFKYGVDRNWEDMLQLLDKTNVLAEYWIRLFMESLEETKRLIKIGENDEGVYNAIYKRMDDYTGEDVKFFAYGRKYLMHVINGNGTSLTFGDHYDTSDICCLFYYNTRIRKYIYSLYSKYANKFGAEGNMKAIAEMFGGGGHPGAAGFSLPFNIFELRDDDGSLTNVDIVDKIKEVYNEERMGMERQK